MKNKLVLCCILASVCFAPMLPAQTLLSQEIKDVDATSDVTINASLPAAPAPFSLSGTVTGATFVFGYVTAQSSTGGIYTGNIDPATNTYRVLVPGGTYTLSVDYFDSQYTDVTFADPVPVTVSADTVRDINITLTPRFQLTGNITGVDPRLSSRASEFLFGYSLTKQRLWRYSDCFGRHVSDAALERHLHRSLKSNHSGDLTATFRLLFWEL